MTHVAPPSWSEAEFAAQIARATEIFKNKRIEEPLELYYDLFDKYRDSVENLLEESVDLQELATVVREYITDPDKRYALRYLASPPSPMTISRSWPTPSSLRPPWRKIQMPSPASLRSSWPDLTAGVSRGSPRVARRRRRSVASRRSPPQA